MSEPNVPDLLFFINQQIQSRQDLRVELCKASSLLRISLESELFQQPQVTEYFYLWSIYDHVEQSREFNEEALTELIHQQKQCATATAED